MRFGRRCASATVGAAGLLACLEPVTPPPPGPAAVLLVASDTIRAVGGTLTFTATAVDTAGGPLNDIPIVWSVSDSTRGRITSTGTFTAGPAAGRVVVRARAESTDVEDSIAVHAMAEGTVRWRWAASDVSGYMPLLGGPALGEDGSVYILVSNAGAPDHPGTLVALSPQGAVRWTRPLLQVEGSTGPVVVPGTGRILMAGVIVSLIAPTGEILWDTLAAPPNEVGPVFLSGAASSSLLVAAAGKHVVAFDATTQAMRWVSQEAPFVSWLVPPTITTAGDVLAKLSGDTLFQFAGADGRVVRFFLDPDTGVDKRVFGAGPVPVGARYYLPTWAGLAALDTNGPVEWLTRPQSRGMTEPAVGPDGTLYVQNRLFGLWAIEPGGATVWSHPEVQPRWPWIGGAALAADGTVYAAGQDGFYAFGTDGQLRWRFVGDTTPNPDDGGFPKDAFVGSPAIAPDGTVYTFTATHVYAFWASAPPEPNSPWPMWRHDAQRTGWARP